MSTADQHRRDARHFLDRAHTADLEYAVNLGVMANASALLAIEARLAELVEVHRDANLALFGVNPTKGQPQ
ncbi:hypothetical protein [Nocardia brasiliensis]|uniref:hypothetical protein n=1 Tax=Nocardia brasiliensis TaxID=37326 RepID=UPI0033E68EBD